MSEQYFVLVYQDRGGYTRATAPYPAPEAMVRRARLFDDENARSVEMVQAEPGFTVPDQMFLAAGYDQLREAADRFCQAMEKRLPFAQEAWDTYRALRYLLDGKNPDGSEPTGVQA